MDKAIVFPTRKAKALCAYLGFAPGRRFAREELASIFWGGQSNEGARANLRSTLSRLRSALPEASRKAVISDRDTVAFCDERCTTDVAAFRREISSGTPEALERAMGLCQGQLLDGLEGSGATAFEEWLSWERRQLQESMLGVLRRLLEHYIVVGAIERGIQSALQLLEIDALDEAAHRSLIRLYLYQERFGAALDQYDRCRTLLSDELGVDPDPATERLREEIFSQSSSPAPPVETDTLPETADIIVNAAALRARQRRMPTGHPVLAVLAFEPSGAQAVPAYLAEGLAEDLTIELGRFREIGVIAPASAFVYRSTNLSPDAAGRELGADYVLCGTLRVRPGAIRIVVRLLDAETAGQVWAERYDCAPDDIFDLQDDLAHRIVAELANQINNAELVALRRKRPSEWSAYEFWLRGWDRLKRSNISAIQEARRFFDKAIEVDPEFARAYVGLALAHLNEWACHSWNHWFFLKGRALDLARTAVRLDERDNRAQCMLALTNIYSGDYATADSCLTRALELNPNDSDVLAHAAGAMALIGDHDRAVDAGRRALRLAPYHPEWYVVMIGMAFFTARKYPDAIEIISTAPEANCSIPAVLAAAHALNGEPKRGALYRDTVYRHYRQMVAKGAVSGSSSCVDWLLDLDPFQYACDRDHYADGLRRAGFS